MTIRVHWTNPFVVCTNGSKLWAELMTEGVQLQLGGKKDFNNDHLSSHDGLLVLKDVEYTETESYPTAAMLRSATPPIQTRPRTYRIGVI